MGSGACCEAFPPPGAAQPPCMPAAGWGSIGGSGKESQFTVSNKSTGGGGSFECQGIHKEVTGYFTSALWKCATWLLEESKGKPGSKGV